MMKKSEGLTLLDELNLTNEYYIIWNSWLSPVNISLLLIFLIEKREFKAILVYVIWIHIILSLI